MSREPRPLLAIEEPEAEPGRYGCPMLAHVHRVLDAPGQPVHRCHLGWSLHNDHEADYCQLTESFLDCWKVHPERLPALVAATAIASHAVPAAVADD